MGNCNCNNNKKTYSKSRSRKKIVPITFQKKVQGTPFAFFFFFFFFFWGGGVLLFFSLSKIENICFGCWRRMFECQQIVDILQVRHKICLNIVRVVAGIRKIIFSCGVTGKNCDPSNVLGRNLTEN